MRTAVSQSGRSACKCLLHELNALCKGRIHACRVMKSQKHRGITGSNSVGLEAAQAFATSEDCFATAKRACLPSAQLSSRDFDQLRALVPFLAAMWNRSGAVIYVGNLPDDIREREIDDLFYKVRLGGAVWLSGAVCRCADLTPACICRARHL